MNKTKTKAELLVELDNAQKRIAGLEAAAADKRAEDRWQFAIEGAGDGVWDWNPQTNRVFYSQQWKAMLGYADHEIGDSMDDWKTLVHPDDLAAVLDRLNQYLEGKVPDFHCEHRLRCKDGSYKWVLDSGKVFEWMEDHRPLRVIGTHKDITELKRAEAALHKSQALLHETASIGNVGGWEIDIDTLKPSWTEQVYRIHEVDMDFNPTLDLGIHFYAPEAQAVIDQAVRDAVRFGKPFDFVLPFITAKGNHRWVHTIGSADLEHHRVRGFFQDVTAQKEAEQQVNQLRRLYATLSQVNQTIVRVKDRTELYQSICDVAAKFGEFSLAWVGLVDDDSGDIQPVAASGADIEHWPLPIVNIHEKSHKGSLTVTALRTTKVVISNDILADARVQGFWSDLQPYAYHASAVVPFRLGGKTIGVLILISSEVEIFDRPDELKLLEEMSLDISFALDTLDAEAERRRVEEALKESETRFSTAFFTSPVSQSVISQGNNEIIAVNDACCRLFGYSREELIGGSTAKLNLWDNPANRLSAVEELQKTGRLLPRETTIRTKSGETRAVIVAIEPISWNGLPSLISTIFDITGRKQAEEALKESEKKYRALHESMMDGFVQVALDGKIVDFNEIYRQMLGYSADELRQVTYPQLTPEKWHAYEAQIVNEQILARGYSDVYEKEYRRKDGSIFPIELHTVLMRDDKGQPASMWGIARDITARKQAEQKQRESEERFRTTLDSMLEGCQIISPDWRYLYVNPAVASQGHFACEELQGHTMMEMYPGIENTEMFAVLRRCMENRVTYWMQNEFTYPDGSQGWFDLSITPVPEGIFILSIDITERKRAEETLKESEHKFHSLYQSMVELSAIHEIVYDSSGTAVDYRILDCNPAFEQIIGTPRQQAVGALASKLYGTGEPPYFAEYLKVAQTGVSSSFETEFAPLGKTFHISVFSPQKDRFATVATDITERKQTEQKIKESEARYRGLFDDSPVSLWEEDFSAVKAHLDVLRREGVTDLRQYLAENPQAIFECAALVKVLDVNKATLALLGATKKEDLLGNLATSLKDEAVQGFAEELVSIADGHYRYEWEGDDRRVDGSMVNVHLVWSVAPGHEQDLSRVLVSLTDVTERNRAVKELRASEEKYRSLLESLDSVVAMLDRDGKFLYMNELAADQLGSTPAQLTGKTMFELFPEQVATQQMASIQAVIAANRGSIFESLSFVEGQPRWYRTSIQPLHDENGQVAAVIINSTDIHELKTLQQDLQELNHSLEEKVQQRTAEVMDLYDNAPAGYHSMDRDGRFVNINQTELSWLGYTREEMIGSSISRFITPASLETFRQRYPTLKEVGTLSDLEVEFVRKDGSFLSVLVNATAVYDANGDFLLSRTTIIDNTEHKKAENALRHANAELARAMRTKDEFLANMSHELRTPLNGILGLSEALQLETYGALNEKQLRALKNIESSGRHLLELINDILDLSKIEAGKLEVRLEPVSIADVCQASLIFIKEPALKKGLTVDFMMDQSVTIIRADSKRLKQILVNLLSNAVKFTPSGGKVTLDVRANPENNCVELSVSDTGIGIAAEDLQRLFSPFTQLDNSLTRSNEGTGLGLAMVKSLAEMHKGSVFVESQVGKGTRFTVSLPWQDGAPAETSAEPTAQTAGEIEQPSLAKSGATILLAEDNPTNVMVLGDYLEAIGYSLVYASDGYEALAKAHEKSPDLILMDVQMPNMDGLEAIRRLRANPKFAATPIVALTALAMVGDQDRCIEAGATDYMSKPVHLEELAAVIRKRLAG